jgi:putative phosphoesterase
MRVAALYDIHGNLPALEAVLAEVGAESVDRIVVGGDVVPGPIPRETFDLLLSLDIPIDFIRGNGDRAVLDAMNGSEPTSVPEQFRPLIRWTAEQLDDDHREILESWPPTLALDVEGTGKVLFCHATPQSDMPIFTRETAEERLRPIFEGLDADLVVCGHTHMQFDRTVGPVRVVNAGSVGMPFGEPGAYWLLLDSGVDLRHTSYDLRAAAERIKASEYPQAEMFADRNVLDPPTQESIIEAYSKVELK